MTEPEGGASQWKKNVADVINFNTKGADYKSIAIWDVWFNYYLKI